MEIVERMHIIRLVDHAPLILELEALLRTAKTHCANLQYEEAASTLAAAVTTAKTLQSILSAKE